MKLTPERIKQIENMLDWCVPNYQSHFMRDAIYELLADRKLLEEEKKELRFSWDDCLNDNRNLRNIIDELKEELDSRPSVEMVLSLNRDNTRLRNIHMNQIQYLKNIIDDGMAENDCLRNALEQIAHPVCAEHSDGHTIIGVWPKDHPVAIAREALKEKKGE